MKRLWVNSDRASPALSRDHPHGATRGDGGKGAARRRRVALLELDADGRALGRVAHRGFARRVRREVHVGVSSQCDEHGI